MKIQEKRESPEVALTLDILKHGKRFHATVSFDTDTGMQDGEGGGGEIIFGVKPDASTMILGALFAVIQTRASSICFGSVISLRNL